MNEKEALDAVIERSFDQLKITLLELKKCKPDSIEGTVFISLFAGIFLPITDIKEYIMEKSPTSFIDKYIAYEEVYNHICDHVDGEEKYCFYKKSALNES